MSKELKLVDKGVEAFDSNKLSLAKSLFEEVIEINPDNIKSYFYLGNIFHIQGQLGKAIKAFNKVLDLEPSHTDASISLSVILNDIGRYEQASEVFEKANSKVKSKGEGVNDPHINKKFSAKHYEIAEMYFSYNRYDEALFEYNKAVALDSDNLDIRIKIAKVYSKKGFTSKAMEELKRLKNENPNYIQARVALGLLHYGNGNTIEAQSEWEFALSKAPDNKELQMYIQLSRSAIETNLTSSL
ncbi:MAG: tetratricopeptide repeat protein [Bacteriovoracaceae bacterium]|jgi:tetratricopeptide (TPR) repeat protein|nr:tetratricopeptide repeat protein [Bacteriovoracaceae bacterium]